MERVCDQSVQSVGRSRTRYKPDTKGIRDVRGERWACLCVHLGRESSSDVRRTVMKHDIKQAAPRLLMESIAALLGCDILLKCQGAPNWLYRNQVHANDAR
jgi:hypothetical protein